MTGLATLTLAGRHFPFVLMSLFVFYIALRVGAFLVWGVGR
jgi:hypothetical protein